MNNMNPHEIIIGLVIVIIIAIQLFIFLQTRNRINEYKQILEGKEFSTIKVFIPENQIENITVEEIMKDIDKYSVNNLNINIDSYINIIPDKKNELIEIAEEDDDSFTEQSNY